MNKLTGYIRLIRFKYHITFICVVMGAFIMANQPIYTLIKPLLIIYLSFNVFLYGGLYALNDIADVESDSKHPSKKNRPLPSKVISVKSAYIFALTFIFLGLLIAGLYFGKNIFLVYLLFIAVNQAYTRFAKKIPYVEILFNGLTYPMRFFLGAMLVTEKIPYLLSIAVFLFALGFASVRRLVEMDSPGREARRVLRYYTKTKLIIVQAVLFFIILAVLIIDYPLYNIWYAVIIFLYIFFIFGNYFFRRLTIFHKWLFLK